MPESMDVGALLRPGMEVFVVGSSNEPRGLLDAIAESPGAARGVTFTQFPLPGLNRVDLSALLPESRERCFFMSPDLRQGLAEGRVDFVPMQMRAVFDYLRQKSFDLVLVQLARDRQGALRFGPNVDFLEAALAQAGSVAAELNHAFTAPVGTPLADAGAFDLIVETDRSLAELPDPKPDAAAVEIGRLVATRIADGACLQTGIGAIPAAILSALTEKNDLGLHSGLIDAGGAHLIQRGVVNGARKQIDTGRHVVGMGLGGAALFEWLADTPEVVFRGADYTHEVGVIAQLEGFVSVNSAVEVDLFGQVNAEFAAGRQISGTGGSVDFMRAARASKGGRSIVAMTATAGDGRFSRIVPRVPVVTALRTDVDVIVTEYGIADLHGLDLRGRADALVAIAAPEFRDTLREAAAQL